MPIHLVLALPLVMLGVTSTTSMLDISPKKRAYRRKLPADTLRRHERQRVHPGVHAQPFMLFCDDAADHPTTIAAYSRRLRENHPHLEPLLATPISTSELLLGK